MNLNSESFIKTFQVPSFEGGRLSNNISRINIRIVVNGLGEAKGELIRFLAPRTVDAISRKLPLEGRAAIWENEVRVEVPIIVGEEKAKTVVEKGSIVYWPMGKTICIFYNDARSHGRVNMIGRVTENLDIFRQVKSGTKIRLEKSMSK
ncbi:MAG: cyclophilin-like fold protein [Nitrososphaerota archaeon]|nr:cyclophilin-like fold protein [Candidatus Bathyarchaeota archaeon]MDW8048382.1 cyclophilin-like fold protein [Nitrososphaerota archaeon]